MESVKELMEKLGFREGADDAVKAAFIKNLIKQAYGVDVEVPVKYQLKPDDNQPVQLAFNLEKGS
ncbi:MAG: hypothetical protein IT289_09940 [Oligoflexia bacterium]|nr:hypothetical protein [Oligoflexia bacterium]